MLEFLADHRIAVMIAGLGLMVLCVGVAMIAVGAKTTSPAFAELPDKPWMRKWVNFLDSLQWKDFDSVEQLRAASRRLVFVGSLHVVAVLLYTVFWVFQGTLYP
jgi:hypothetical protein